MIEAPAVLLLAWLFGSGARGGTRTTRPLPSGEKPKLEVEPPETIGAWPRAVPSGGETGMKQTGGKDIIGWRRERYSTCIDFLLQDDRSINAFTNLVDSGRVERSEFNLDEIALSVLAHWDIETASGTSEFNFNVGGVFATPKQKHFVSLDVGSNKKVAFCAYDSAKEGIADYFGVLSYERFASALVSLLMLPTDPEWFGELGWAKYYGMDPVRAMQVLTDRRALCAVDVADLRTQK